MEPSLYPYAVVEKNRMHPACLRSYMFQEMAGQTDVKIKKNEEQSRRISEYFSCLKQWEHRMKRSS